MSAGINIPSSINGQRAAHMKAETSLSHWATNLSGRSRPAVLEAERDGGRGDRVVGVQRTSELNLHDAEGFV